MSAFVVHKKHIDALVTAGLEMLSRSSGHLSWYAPAETYRQTHERGEPWGPEALQAMHERRRELRRETAGRVGAMLWAENERSVNHRYDEDNVEDPYVYERYRKPLTPVKVLAALSCYEYQSCEHEDWEHSEARAFCDSLRRAMIRVLPGYEDAGWEITE